MGTPKLIGVPRDLIKGNALLLYRSSLGLSLPACASVGEASTLDVHRSRDNDVRWQARRAARWRITA